MRHIMGMISAMFMALVVLAMIPSVGAQEGQAAPGIPFSGLLVIVRGLELQRSMAPAITTVSGTLVYGRGWWKPGDLDQAFVNSHGIVGYPPSQETARRSGSKPLVVVALATRGATASPFKTDVIISDEDGVRISLANSSARFLERFLVDIVVVK